LTIAEGDVLIRKDSSLSRPWTRLHNYYKRNAGRFVFRRPFAIRTESPLISFTFDDFPRSAFLTGGAILKSYKVAGTYYAALGLLGTEGPSGPLFILDDLEALIAQGHELGCHTFSHCHAWDSDSHRFKESIVKNGVALRKLFPGAEFRSFSYPISEPRPLIKKKTAEHFLCCRAGGQTLNVGTVDLNQLSAFFLEQSQDDIQIVKGLIDHNRAVKGWTIFATHDICSTPSRYGCTPEFFQEVVRYAVDSGSLVLPVRDALQLATGVTSERN
jgi:peptidoglycan/xylan/chitin deacetylase (PgdA/CDA1 family)